MKGPLSGFSALLRPIAHKMAAQEHRPAALGPLLLAAWLTAEWLSDLGRYVPQSLHPHLLLPTPDPHRCTFAYCKPFATVRWSPTSSTVQLKAQMLPV